MTMCCCIASPRSCDLSLPAKRSIGKSKSKKPEEDFYVALDAQPSLVRFDPDYTVLADVAFDKPNEMLKAQIENHQDLVGRLLACKLLGDRKTHAAVEMLETALNQDPFYGVRIAAAAALGKHESDEAIAILQQSWQKQDDARVRLEVVQRLTNRYAEQTPALIAEILSVEKNPAIAAAAIKGLGRFHGDESKKQLIKYLNSESFRNELATAAISAIGQQNDASYQTPLLRTLKQHEDRFTASDFGRGLTTLAQVSRSGERKDDVREFLVGYVNHPKTTVRTAAIGALGSLGDPKSISVLEAFTDSQDQRVARSADQALAKLRESKPTVPKELIELRKEMASMKKASEKVQADLKELREQLKERK